VLLQTIAIHGLSTILLIELMKVYLLLDFSSLVANAKSLLMLPIR